MTAEVAILNAEGVVLAADSAVTLDLRDGQKAIPRASKIYALSSRWPVALMFYGNARFMDVPWETLVKEYRRSRGDIARERVEDFARDFLEFLSASAHRYPKHAFERGLAQCARAYSERFIDSLIARIRGRAPTERTVRKAAEELLQTPPSEGHVASAEESERAAALREHHMASIRKAMESVLERTPLSKSQKERLEAHLLDLVASEIWVPWHGQSGLVFAGFGAEQWFPAIEQWDVDLLHARGGLKARRSLEDVIGERHSALIAPFGDAAEIVAFVDGIHPDFVNHILCDYKLFGRGSRQQKAPEDLLRGSADRLFTNRIAEMVTGLPREDLAVMAETLVSLCAFRKRLTGQVETVAGPVDVAAISRGDGLVWVKRKHYFTAELNPQYFQRLEAKGRTS